MKASRSEVTDGIHMSGPYLAFSPPRPAPGGPGCKVGRGLWSVSPGTVPRSDEAEAEGKEESGPTLATLLLLSEEVRGRRSSGRIKPQARVVSA